MMTAECPSEILSQEGTNVAYYNDIEENISQVSETQAALKCQIFRQLPIFFSTFHYSCKFTNGRTGIAVKNCSFCGQWSLMNAEILYTKEFGNGYGEISLEAHPMVKPTTSLFCHGEWKII